MGILRIQKNDNFSIIANHCFRDERLSYRAVGLLCHLLSKPNDWKVRTSDLTKAHREGRDAVIATINELIRFGYISRQKGFGEVIYNVHETPVAAGDEGDFQMAENPQAEAAQPTEHLPGDLLRFVNLFPSHRRRANAEMLHAAWTVAVSKVDRQVLFDALAKQCASWAWTNEPKFVPGIVKWLTEERWNDPIQPKPEPKFKTQADWNSATNGKVVL